MRYLKKFNENLTVDVKKFSEYYLANLLDEGYYLRVDQEFYHTPDYVEVVLSLKPVFDLTIHRIPSNRMYWNDIKDAYIAFITILDENFHIDSKFNFMIDSEDEFFTVTKESIINDEVESLRVSADEDVYGYAEPAVIDKPLNEYGIYSIKFSINI